MLFVFLICIAVLAVVTYTICLVNITWAVVIVAVVITVCVTIVGGFALKKIISIIKSSKK